MGCNAINNLPIPSVAHFAIYEAEEEASFRWLVEKTWKSYVVTFKLRLFAGHARMLTYKKHDYLQTTA